MKSSIPFYFLLLFFPLLVNGQRKTVQVEAPSVSKNKINNASNKKSNQQNVAFPSTEKKVSDRINTWAIGVSTATNSGLIGGMNVRKIWGKRNQNLNVLNLDLAHIRDYREFNSPYSYNGQTYTEGKLNYLFTVRPEFGKEITLLKKASQGGPALKGIFSTGPTLGLQAPYMVDVATSTNNPYGNQSTISVTMKDFLENKYPSAGVVRESGMFTSIGKSKFVPGWHVKSAFNIEFNSEKSSYMAIEVGFIIDVFNSPIEMLNQSTQRPVYTTGYLTFLLGRTK